LALIAFYISGHGFGHASREIEVMRSLRALDPGVRLMVRTSVARWMFDTAAPQPIDFQPATIDTGIAQIDSLQLDEEATARAASQFYARFDSHVAYEAALLQAHQVDLVVGDVPPLAFAAGARAGVRSVAISNFTWDWIYSAYDAFRRDAGEVLSTIRDAYAAASTALRLPFSGGFAAIRDVRDIPLIARRSSRVRSETRRLLGVDSGRTLVLASFGAYGAGIPLDRLEQSVEFTVIAPPREAPAGLRYEDLVAAADVVVSKPGYGIVSECIVNGTALLYTSRGRFAEYDVFVREMPEVLRCRFLPQEDLIAGRWNDGIRELTAMPPPRRQLHVDGADVAARFLLDALH
jgi:L-arabinokinase